MSGAIDRMIARRGQTWTMQTWTVGAEDAYKQRPHTLGTATSVVGIRSETAKERVMLDERGEERTIDAQLIVTTALVVTDIEDATKKAPVFTSPSGVKYDAIAVGREAEIIGARRIFLSKRRSTT